MKNYLELLGIAILSAVGFITFYRLLLFITNYNELLTNTVSLSVCLVGIVTAIWKVRNPEGPEGPAEPEVKPLVTQDKSPTRGPGKPHATP